MLHTRIDKRKRSTTWLGVLLLVILARPAPAGEIAKVSWHTDVGEAWKATQQNRRPLLVFVTHDRCVHCERMKDGTLSNRAVASEINRAFVPLTVDGGGGSQLVKDLNVRSYPATFIISPQAVVLDRIDAEFFADFIDDRFDCVGDVG